ncbi:MAG: hypothetical protein ACHQ50_13320, partial [Fimbriimonadales bacterium]
MTEQTELKLRDLLLDMPAHPTPQEIDERVRTLIGTRFEAEEAVLSEAVQERHLAAIRARLTERSNPST